jgi:hypothetical protein
MYPLTTASLFAKLCKLATVALWCDCVSCLCSMRVRMGMRMPQKKEMGSMHRADGQPKV